jgi:NAD(P)-dependent dehydrogenase (short-subunit alcohol dehydrogenase family)
LGGLFLITADGLSVAEHVATELRNHGARAVIFDQNLLASAGELRDGVLQLQRTEPITGILHLAPLTAASFPSTLREWRRQTQIQSKSLFQLLQLCAGSLREAKPRAIVLAASLLGGFFGRNKQTGAGLPTGGSNYGLLNSLKSEWPNIQASAIDFDHRLSPDDIGRMIIAEMISPDAQLEVGYPEGRRTLFSPVRSSLERRALSKQPSPSADWAVLALGGARGITAEIAHSLCLPGMKMVLVGRSPEPVEESLDTLGVDTVEELRRVYLDRAKGIRQAQTPAEIERQIRQLLRGREIRRNLDALREKGAQVEYHALDVRTEAFASLIDSIYLRHGRLDAVIHGAGVIEDKLLVDKSSGSFDRVFDTKVDSAYLLSQRLRAYSLKLVVLFSSIAGRIGNAGQADYAAANEVLNCFASRMKQQWPSARVVAINWGPWEDVGMASDGVRDRFKERGIAGIKSEQGRKFFLDEISFGDSELVEVIAGDGPWGEMTTTNSISPENFGDLLAQVNILAEDFWAM